MWVFSRVTSRIGNCQGRRRKLEETKDLARKQGGDKIQAQSLEENVSITGVERTRTQKFLIFSDGIQGLKPQIRGFLFLRVCISDPGGLW